MGKITKKRENKKGVNQKIKNKNGVAKYIKRFFSVVTEIFLAGLACISLSVRGGGRKLYSPPFWS